ncbi:MAG: histidine ammonia-lyase [Bdellovibrionales bacterium]|nr:histidine ammonia-lyase [Bdellovibrionales bacterium]
MKKQKQKAIVLTGSPLTIESCSKIASGNPVLLGKSTKRKVERSRALVEKKAQDSTPTYGVNTGFGFLAKKQIPQEQLVLLQSNLVKSHAAGWGTPLDDREVRLGMALRLNTLLRGHSGARLELCQQIEKYLSHGIYPIVPEYGSVGASGDLIPLSHLCLPLIGEGEVVYRGQRMRTETALKKARLSPIKLQAKEGLSFVNGTEMMLAVGALAVYEAHDLARSAVRIAALSFEALGGNPTAFRKEIHELRNQKGQQLVAALLRSELRRSEVHRASGRSERVQDPYSLRCIPQILGPTFDSLEYVSTIVERELGAVTDNPIVLPEREEIVSGGNFHGQALALVFDFAAIAVAELANVAERRMDMMFSPVSSGLNAFLAHNPGLESGYMTLQYLAGALVNENKVLSHPASTDSIPGNVGIEDHVSMGMTAAKKLKRIVKNTRCVLACEWLAAAQATDLRRRSRLGNGTALTHRILRRNVPTLRFDRILQPEIARVARLLEQGELHPARS